MTAILDMLTLDLFAKIPCPLLVVRLSVTVYRHCERSEAISERINFIGIASPFGFAMTVNIYGCLEFRAKSNNFSQTCTKL